MASSCSEESNTRDVRDGNNSNLNISNSPIESDTENGEEILESNLSKQLKNQKKSEPGIIYLSYIPPFMTVRIIHEYFLQFGNVGRVFLQPDAKNRKKGKPSKFFTEGWIEFVDKKVAKRVALMLNGQQVGGRRKTPFYDSLWSIKYLHRFKWAHLSERLAYEKAVRDQRLRTEISQVKREANFYMQSVDRSLKLARKRKKEDGEKRDDTGPSQIWVKQKRTDEEMKELQKQRKKQKKLDIKEDGHKILLKDIFSGGF